MLQRAFKLPFQVDIVFVPDAYESPSAAGYCVDTCGLGEYHSGTQCASHDCLARWCLPACSSGADALQQARDLSAQFADVAAQRRAQFDEAFESRFGGESSGMSPEQVETAKAAMSNLLGGMTYFHGAWCDGLAAVARRRIVEWHDRVPPSPRTARLIHCAHA